MARVQRELEATGAADRRAHFIAALSLCWPDGHCESFEGRVDGALVWPPRGGQGFGYDPIFVPDGHDITFGEMRIYLPPNVDVTVISDVSFGNAQVFGLDNEGISFAESNPELMGDDIVDAVEEAKGQILDGEIEVPTEP